jgi:hypothetical protein
MVCYVKENCSFCPHLFWGISGTATELIIWVTISATVPVANWTKSELTRSKCGWTRIRTISNEDETNSRLDCPYSLACNKFSNHKFIINKHVLVSWGLLRNKLQFCLLIRNETSIKKNFHIKCNKMTHRQKIANNNGILFPKLVWPTVRFFLRSLE